MAAHDDLIGNDRENLRRSSHVFWREFDDAVLSPDEMGWLIGYLYGMAPAEVDAAFHMVLHERGDHQYGRCPERCPRF